MKVWLRFLLVCAVAFAGAQGIAAEPAMLRNPPPKEDPDEEPEDDCECPPQEVNHGCVKIKLDLGRTSVLSGRRPVSLRVYTNTASEAIFTPEELKVVMDYTFDRFGPEWSDRNLPARVVFIQRTGQEIHFRFGNGESLGIPDPGLHRDLNERLQMVDAEGWATAEDPAYYDLYPGDGSVWRFYATDVTGRLGELVSHTDPRGRVTTLEDFGVEIVRGPHGWVRQVLTPSRLADVTTVSGTEYQVAVYPLTERPAMSEGVYVPPQTTPLRRLTMKRGTNGRELLTTLQKGNGQPREYAYTFVNEDWGLRTPEGLDKTRELMESDDGGTVQAVTLTQKGGEILKQKKELYEEADWGFAKVRSTEGAGNATRWKTWDYYFTTDPANGAYKGKVKERRTSGGEIVRYRYDAQGRTVETMRTDTAESFLEVTTASYQPVAAGDVTSLMDTRPRCEVVAERDPESGEMVEVSRTYHVYLPTQEITERAVAAGAPYGAAGALREVKTWYAPDDADWAAAGRLKSVRHEDGRIEAYTYAIADGRWVETVTALHEQAPEPISGKTTRRATLYDDLGNVVERNQEAFIDGAWRLIDRAVYEYDIEGHVVKETDFAGRETVSVWGDGCCGKSSETLPDGTVHTYAYDGTGRVVRKTKRAAGEATVVYTRDPLGRVVRLEQTGLNQRTYAYDALGRTVRAVDALGGETRTAYSADGNTVTNVYADLSTEVRRTDAAGRTLEIAGTAARPQVFTRRPRATRVATGARWEEETVDLAGNVIARSRPGANGTTLTATFAYDAFGRVVAESEPGRPAVTYAYDAQGTLAARRETVGDTWREVAQETAYVLRDDGAVWQETTLTQRCSDPAIAPLTQTRRERLTGLTPEATFATEMVCVRGNVTRLHGNDAERVTERPSRTNPEIQRYAFGNLIAEIDSACVTNRVEIDALDRRVAETDGRGNRTAVTHDARGLLVASKDAIGATTSYAYDLMGRTTAITNALGNVTVYRYDLRGNKVYEGGAVYPVRYTYDDFGNRISMTTYRDEASGVGDTTTWTYDDASGLLLAKTYADGKGLSYTYTASGRLATRTDARGIVTTYTWDGWGRLVAVAYSDGTPSVTYAYDALGRQTSATDAAGTTTFAYDAFGDVVSESNLKTLTRHYDAFGRDVGYSLDGERQTIVAYDPATGRIAGMDGFKWDYLPSSNLKSKLTYPNGAEVTWTYEPHRDLLTAVTNDTHSAYVYANDLLGRRVFKNDEHYGYNVRNELTSANAVSYAYDDIGNRTVAEGKTYTANNLNQYTQIDGFTPEYDADGNQTLIKTSTGIWSVTYNAENRPVRWQSGDTEITMAFDSMGRRVSMRTLTPGFDLLQRFVYKDFLCVRQLRGPDATPYQSYVWDPTEPIATRPLLLRDAASIPFYYYHDGNKNVAGLTDASRVASLAYAYTPYGAPSLLPSSLPLDNPFQFSSEVYDAALGLSYYNYRHYLQTSGRFVSRDPLACLNLFQFHLIANEYVFTGNTPNNEWDFLGMIFEIEYTTPNGDYHSLSLEEGGGIDEIEKMFDVIEKEQGNICRVWCGGHGDGRTVIINGEWDGMSFWATDNEKTLRIKAKSGEGIILFEPSRTEPGLFRQENITDRLKKLGADDAEYVYNACLSAHGDENISRRTSQIFPKSTVKGNRGYSYLGIEEPHLYIRRTYQNGKRISLF